MSEWKPAEKLPSCIGKRVESVWLSQDRTALALLFEDNTARVWHAEGDCCANSWIEDVQIFGFKGELLEAGSDPDRPGSSEDKDEFDVLDINFYCFKTPYGRLLIELRTSHNGYYGGHLELDEYKTVELDKNWRLIE